jgi:probable F420-dependent oxidoreductase
MSLKTMGRVGIWLGVAALHPAELMRREAALIEELGFGAIWYGEAVAREAFALGAILLGATRQITVASGIANIWVRDAAAMTNGARALAEAWPDRFVLGIGVSHPPLVNRRGHRYEQPLTAMREYLDAMERAPYTAPAPAEPAPVVLAALGPKMLELARERSAGAHPYFVPVEHTKQAREILGKEKFLAPEQAVVLAPDRQSARPVGDRYMNTYLGLDNYRNNLLRLGWPEMDLKAPGSDALFDALVAYGPMDRIHKRVEEHLAAGADHVALSILTPTPTEPLDGALGQLADGVLRRL